MRTGFRSSSLGVRQTSSGLIGASAAGPYHFAKNNHGDALPVPARAINRWIGDSVERRALSRVLSAAAVDINYIHEPQDGQTWGLILGLPADLAEVVGTRREVLLWGSTHAKAQARDLENALAFMALHELRLAQDLLVLITADREGAAVYDEATAHLPLGIVTITTSDLRNFTPFGAGTFGDAIRSRLFVRDLYDLRQAVTRTADFFGRSDLLSRIERDIGAGQTHVGIFGLRKIGKTSFINRLRENLRAHGRGLIAHVDLQRSTAINPSPEYLLWHLGEMLADGNRRVRNVPGLRLLGKYETFSDIPSKETIFELFDHDVRLVIQRTGMSVILILDEIERIYPASESSPWASNFTRLWQLLRGLDQENPGGLSFVISGTNPRCVEQHEIFGEDNPVYNYFSIHYLGPLARAEVAELLSSYGKKMGLQWSSSSVARTFEDTGGHPALLRSYASMVHQRSYPRLREVLVTADETREVANLFLTKQGPLLAQVVAILKDQYTDEFEILLTLAEGRVNEFREMARAFPEDTAHLIGYGICGEPARSTRLSSALLHTYLQRRRSSEEAATQLADASLIGETVDQRYLVESIISASGGYADVYLARSADHAQSDGPSSEYALKVLRYGQLSLVEREVEVLQRFKHPNIVQFLGSGVLEDGRVYLAMEYLQGTLLRSYCEAATRPTEHTLMSWAVSLLDALVLIHPKDSEIRAMRSSRSFDGDLQTLLEARYGYIHRDIKPENIVVTRRGPVLIDFNISVTVSSPVLTTSATPGYLPLELVGASWSPRIDLFQLGVTLLQVASGDMLTVSNRDDLVEVMQSSVSPRVSEYLRRLIDTSSSGYQSAYTARRDAQRVLDHVGR
jgi:hypothetical protein